jgi:hypothetical protein
MQFIDKKGLGTSVICTIVFALVLVACGGGNGGGILGGGGGVIPGGGSPSSSTKTVLANGPLPAKILPSGFRPLLAGFFFQTASTTAAQSFSAKCLINFNTGTFVGQFIPIAAESTNCGAFSVAQPTFQPGVEARALDAGSLSTLTVIGQGTGLAGSRVVLYVNGTTPSTVECTFGASDRCDDRTHTFQVSDNAKIVPYLIPSAGSNITRIDVYYAKQ